MGLYNEYAGTGNSQDEDSELGGLKARKLNCLKKENLKPSD